MRQNMASTLNLIVYSIIRLQYQVACQIAVTVLHILKPQWSLKLKYIKVIFKKEIDILERFIY